MLNLVQKTQEKHAVYFWDDAMPKADIVSEEKTKPAEDPNTILEFLHGRRYFCATIEDAREIAENRWNVGMVFEDYEEYGMHIAFDVFHIPEVVAEELYMEGLGRKCSQDKNTKVLKSGHIAVIY